MRTPHSKPRHGRTAVLHAVLAIVALLTAVSAGLYILFVAFLKAGPVLDRNRFDLPQTIQIQDSVGEVLYEFSTGDHRLFLQQNDIPDKVKKAVVAIEDERFLWRPVCIDVRALLRALKVNIFEDELQGGSTLTQQLTRMLYLTREKTITRKLYEILLSCRLEFLLTKDDILTLYLNGVSFGNGVNGIEAGAQKYFGIPASRLSIAQAAALVSIPQRPSYYNPYGAHLHSAIDAPTLRAIRRGTLSGGMLSPELVATGLLPKIAQGKQGIVRIPGRSDSVLKAMRRLSFIDQRQFEIASDELLTMTFVPLQHPISAPHFALRVRSDIESLLQNLALPLQWESVGMTVHTTLNPLLQNVAEKVIKDAEPMLRTAGAKNAALVAVDRKTRNVVAYVGNSDFFATDAAGQIDMAQAPRQPGSSFKPLIYATAFQLGYTPESIVWDEPIHIGSDVPRNYEGGFRGRMTIRDALARSRNIPAIKTFLEIGGEDTVLPVGARAGVTTPLEYKEEMLKENPNFTFGWPMSIGSVEVPLIEMIQLYATIADEGLYRPLRILCSVTNRAGKPIVAVMEEGTRQAIDPQAARWIDDILRDEKSRPEGYWRTMLTLPDIETAVKTGTSNTCFQRDVFGRCTEYGVNNVWTLGYTDDLVVGVWVGNADNATLDPLADGLTVAAPIWREFLLQATPLYNPESSSCE